jgi:hypothetical protein
MLRRLSTLVGVSLVLWTAGARAQDAQPVSDVTGAWTMTWEGPRGPATMQLELTVEGTTLTGRIETRGGWQDIKDGKVTSDGIEFALERGRGERTFRMEFKGTLASSGELKGTVSTPRGDELPWTATRK